MGEHMSKTASYLKALANLEYGIPAPIAGVVNYLVDSFFAKEDQRALERMSREKYVPDDPKTHIKETWLECEIHKAITLNRTYPLFAKSQNAWAFAQLFDQSTYEIVPYIDQYEFKEYVKNSYEYRVQQERIQTSIDNMATLPICGTFFVQEKMTKTHIIVHMDLGHESMACVITVTASPEKKEIAEKFLMDLDSSIKENDIYYGKCLTFLRGFLGFTRVTPTGWGDIILKDDVIREIKDNSVGVLENMDKLASIGMNPSRNMILISPPGMAKTTIFRAISDEIDGRATCIWCTGKSVQDSSDVTSMFEAARALAPCVVFIEDMDLFGRDRSGLSDYRSQVLNEFLACLDGMHQNTGVIIMASTNDFASMDEALVNRPGRFDVKIVIPFPDKEDRSDMLLSFFKRIRARPDASVTRGIWDTVIDMTDGLTGAYIRELANATVIRAIASGNYADGAVVFKSEDLNAAAEQVVRNFRIGKAAHKSQIHADVSVSGDKLCGSN